MAGARTDCVKQFFPGRSREFLPSLKLNDRNLSERSVVNQSQLHKFVAT
jgi:hypothetical protein